MYEICLTAYEKAIFISHFPGRKIFHNPKVCNNIKGHYSINNQLERSGTSIGANIREANYAHSKNDFVSKLQIALKECYETEYWIELFVKAEMLDREEAKKLYNECGTIRKILISSINTAKDNNGE